MSNQSRPAESNESEDRAMALVHIGWISISMLGICIPLCAILAAFSPSAAMGLPMLIVGGAIGCGILLWTRPFKKKEKETKEIESLRGTIAELNERLNNFEIMDRYEAELANRRLESQSLEESGDSEKLAESP